MIAYPNCTVNMNKSGKDILGLTQYVKNNNNNNKNKSTQP